VPRPSLFEFAGGSAAFLRLAQAHHERCLADPVLNHPFSHGTRPDHVERLGAYWAEVLGGPPAFTGAGGDQSAVLAIHSGTDAEWAMGRNFIECFMAAADDAGLPDDAEFRTALRAYMTWAVGVVYGVTPAGSQVPAGLPMPHWTWEGLA